MSVLGAGLLLGTALSVIIPEGIQTLNMAYKGGHHHENHSGPTASQGHHEEEENPAQHLIGVALVLGFIFMLIIDQVATSHSGGGAR